jgi:hypothetical protein
VCLSGTICISMMREGGDLFKTALSGSQPPQIYTALWSSERQELLSLAKRVGKVLGGQAVLGGRLPSRGINRWATVTATFPKGTA